MYGLPLSTCTFHSRSGLATLLHAWIHSRLTDDLSSFGEKAIDFFDTGPIPCLGVNRRGLQDEGATWQVSLDSIAVERLRIGGGGEGGEGVWTHHRLPWSNVMYPTRLGVRDGFADLHHRTRLAWR